MTVDLSRLGQVPRELLERYVRRCQEEGLMDDEMIEALTPPKLRSRAEVDAEIAKLARHCIDVEWNETAVQPWEELTRLCREPVAEAPAPPERMTEAERFLERLATAAPKAAIVCTDRLSESAIAQARAEERMLVLPDGTGYAIVFWFDCPSPPCEAHYDSALRELDSAREECERLRAALREVRKARREHAREGSLMLFPDCFRLIDAALTKAGF